MSKYKEIMVQAFGTLGRGWVEVQGEQVGGSMELLYTVKYGYRGKTWEEAKTKAEAKVQEFKKKYGVKTKGNYERLK